MSAPGTDARMVAAVRAILGAFDWETGDRQYALEAIEQIVDGGTGKPAPASECQHLGDDGGPLASMKGSEVGERYLDGRSRRDLEGLLLYISGYCPAAFMDAVNARTAAPPRTTRAAPSPPTSTSRPPRRSRGVRRRRARRGRRGLQPGLLRRMRVGSLHVGWHPGRLPRGRRRARAVRARAGH